MTNRISIDKTVPNAGTLPVRNETATYTHNRLMSTDTAMYGYDNEGQLSSKQEGATTSYTFEQNGDHRVVYETALYEHLVSEAAP